MVLLPAQKSEMLPPPQLITACGDPQKQANADAFDLHLRWFWEEQTFNPVNRAH